MDPLICSFFCVCFGPPLDKLYFELFLLLLRLKVRNHVCAECGSAFAEKAQLIKHDKAVHLQVREAQCKQCHKSFKQGHYLR